MEQLLRQLLRASARRGLSGSGRWAMIAVVLGTVRIIQRLASPKPGVVWRQRLAPGDAFKVTVRKRG